MPRSGWLAVMIGLLGLALNRYYNQQLQTKLLAALSPADPGFVPGGPGHFDPVTGIWMDDVLPSHDLLPGDYIPTLIDPPVPAPLSDPLPSVPVGYLGGPGRHDDVMGDLFM